MSFGDPVKAIMVEVGLIKINHINVMLNRDSNPGPQVVDALDHGDLRSLAHFVHLLSADYIFCVVSFVQLLSIFVVSLSLSLSLCASVLSYFRYPLFVCLALCEKLKHCPSLCVRFSRPLLVPFLLVMFLFIFARTMGHYLSVFGVRVKSKMVMTVFLQFWSKKYQATKQR